MPQRKYRIVRGNYQNIGSTLPLPVTQHIFSMPAQNPDDTLLYSRISARMNVQVGAAGGFPPSAWWAQTIVAAVLNVTQASTPVQWPADSGSEEVQNRAWMQPTLWNDPTAPGEYSVDYQTTVGTSESHGQRKGLAGGATFQAMFGIWVKDDTFTLYSGGFPSMNITLHYLVETIWGSNHP